MVKTHAKHGLIVDANLTDYFRTQIAEAVAEHQLDVSPEAQHYVVNLLAFYTHSETLFEQTDDGLGLRPLAMLYSDAIDADTYEQRNQSLKRLGDVAMFISGVFPHSLSRKLVDVDYYISMGGSAYGYLSNNARESQRWRALGEVFDELSTRFGDLVELLGEICSQASFSQARDVLRTYELWLRTGSRRARRQLLEMGIEPNPGLSLRAH